MNAFTTIKHPRKSVRGKLQLLDTPARTSFPANENGRPAIRDVTKHTESPSCACTNSSNKAIFLAEFHAPTSPVHRPSYNHRRHLVLVTMHPEKPRSRRHQDERNVRRTGKTPDYAPRRENHPNIATHLDTNKTFLVACPLILPPSHVQSQQNTT